ncbi:hypothetical protein PP655_gp098 [Bacillus phage PBC4]|uniref:Uncharacterized protein n=1 Tax=Bacillus phage PBC4 TaxID=1675028 RepID=A0A1D6X8D9_9CAUD|nr:hypothetical protein PP655_gp098 [Bacillus phage PBC4]AKQ08290.1 hypothetical protein PBC4_098 [Bacillus phage PBC4]
MNRVSIEDQLQNAVGFFILPNRIIKLTFSFFTSRSKNIFHTQHEIMKIFFKMKNRTFVLISIL